MRFNKNKSRNYVIVPTLVCIGVGGLLDLIILGGAAVTGNLDYYTNNPEIIATPPIVGCLAGLVSGIPNAITHHLTKPMYSKMLPEYKD